MHAGLLLFAPSHLTFLFLSHGEQEPGTGVADGKWWHHQQYKYVEVYGTSPTRQVYQDGGGVFCVSRWKLS